MKRQVLLIKGYSKDENERNIDNYYINCYYTFFRNIVGGAYEENEIICLEEPNIEEIKSSISKTDIDFAIIVIVGHSATQEERQLIQINKNDIIKAGQIIFDAKKQIIIIESCRSLTENIYDIDLNDKIPKFANGGIVRLPIDRNQAKDLYNKQIIKCDPGNIICFACKKDEVAKNYYFSYALLQVAFNWHLKSENHLNLLYIYEIMNFLSSEIPKISENQNPEIVGNVNFPFAISKF